MVGDPVVVVQAESFGEVEVELCDVAIDTVSVQSGLQQAGTDVRPSQVRKRHVDQQYSRHRMVLSGWS